MNEKKGAKPGIVVFTILLILLASFVSCDNKLNVSNTNAVRFSTEIGRKVTANSEWQADDEVGIYMLEHGTGTAATTAPERANRHYTADTAFQTSGFSPADNANTLKWNDIADNADDTFDFISYYPWAYLAHTEDGAGTTSFYDTDTLYIDINRDRGTHEQDTGKADVLWGRTDTVQNNTSTVRLKLDHMLSRLIVNISPSTTVDAVAINDATAFAATVKGLDNITTMSLDDGSLADVSGLTAPIAMKDISDTLTTTERAEGKRRFEAVLIPVGNTDALANVSLEFTLTGGAKAGTYTWKPSTTGAVAEGDKHLIHFDKGKQHVYNMTLNTDDNEVAVAAIQIEIKDWDTGDGINAPAVKAYRLSFDGNNATSGTAPEAIIAHGGSSVILPDPGTLEKQYHYVYGWNTLPDGNGTQYAAGDSFTIPTNNNVTLYARWVPKVKAVSARDNHTMILAEDGTLWATGYNIDGQLGDGTWINRTTPVRVKASTTPNDFMTDVKSVSAGADHTMILKNNGTLWATGRNIYGQLGINTITYTDIPAQVTGTSTGTLPTVASVATGKYHTIIVGTILNPNDRLLANGRNDLGQLGLGDFNTPVTLPRQILFTTGTEPLPAVASVAAGSHHTLLVDTTGKLWATGNNSGGQLGDGTSGYGANKNFLVPVTSTSTGNLPAVMSVAAGNEHTMIVGTNGTLWATGFNNYGQLGIGNDEDKNTPMQVTDTTIGSLPTVESVAAGGYHTMIVDTDGKLWATGFDEYGQLGLGNSGMDFHITTPEQVSSMGSDVAAVYAGLNHTMIVKKDGTLWATGDNEFGQLGLGDSGSGNHRTTPEQVIF
ncbi:fimbrillin family protein [Parasphaerochaeta coccoides]|uniref:Listeria/Bacterioides repeat-containing protein n=1 Tax=Parasphaerochaeta coccoides (strain ATCC BAA-1237 / DSM 17374 / SPN1) TaxID=760011 RepID=F4GJ08_PARC1|nr:fimbrillin family protein [Parasphaerochaeta coccoides]AEC01303.1 Listeria/Bacterioides repeat-containing protein [Parasphaerochaeta coccoides DSM 17374]